MAARLAGPVRRINPAVQAVLAWMRGCILWNLLYGWFSFAGTTPFSVINLSHVGVAKEYHVTYFEIEILGGQPTAK